jgi:hypothetical protein
MSARILYLDVECAPTVAHVWSLRDLNVGLSQIVSDPYLIGVGYMWDGDKAPRYLSTWARGGRLAMLKALWALLDEADVIVHYNGDNFDTPWIQGELMREGFTPPSPFKSIDLYKVFKKNARFVSHKLDYVAGAILGKHKIATGGHGLWARCITGDEKARRAMARYCKQDVALLPPLLKHARPWLPAAINFALYNGPEGAELACQKCGKADALRPKGTAYTATMAYPQYLCDTKRGGCGGWSRDKKSAFTTAGAGVQR